MKYFSFFLFVVVLAVSPLATTASTTCFGDGRYTANSTYETNLRRIASTLPAEISSSPHGYRASISIGYWPNRLRVTSRCFRRRAGSFSSCAACIAGAFQEAERACPYRREFNFYGRNCSLSLADFRALDAWGPTMINDMAIVMALQAIGLAFLLFLFLQEWRHGRGAPLMRSSSLPT